MGGLGRIKKKIIFWNNRFFDPCSSKPAERTICHEKQGSPPSTESTSEAEQPQDNKVSYEMMPDTAAVEKLTY